MKVCVIGQGYVGLPLALRIAEVGHEVLGFDTNEQLINTLAENKKHINNYFPTSKKDFIQECNIFIIAVPTPLNSRGLPDFSFLKSACILISQAAMSGSLIINESTSYPGTLREIVAPLVSRGNKLTLFFASAPERLDPSNELWNIKNTPRVLAGLNEQATKLAISFYKSFCDNVKEVSSPEVAEAAKIFENTFRYVNIALANEFAQISEKFGLSANEVINAASTKPFGFMKFAPSLGVGGHCIPVDPIYLEKKAKSLGTVTKFINQATTVNNSMPLYILSRLEKILGGKLRGKKICIVGISYKKDVADLRHSPSVSLWRELENRGCLVFFHDDIVKTFNNLNSVALDKSIFDLAVVGVRHSDLNIDKLITCATYLFDCTGTIEGLPTL